MGQLAAGIAHDFNNILAIIVLYAQMALRRSELSDSLRERLEIIDQQAKRATRLIRKIMEFSRPAALLAPPAEVPAVEWPSFDKGRGKTVLVVEDDVATQAALVDGQKAPN